VIWTLVVLVAAGAGFAAFVLSSDDAPEQVATTTTTPATTAAPATTTPDPVGLLAEALAVRLARDAGIEPGPGELECLARATRQVLGPRRVSELADGRGSPADLLTPTEHDGLVRAIVTCLGPDAAAAVLGDGSTTVPPPLSLPDEGAEGNGTSSG
jgi:hypothetical protein